MENQDSFFNQVFSLKGKVNRKNYFIWGIVLFAIKYNIDRLLSLYFTGDPWKFFSYFTSYERHSIFMLSDSDQLFYLTLVLIALPFIWIGTVLTIKRLQSSGLSPWLVLIFFIPFINILSFLILSILPEKESTNASSESLKPLSRIIPKNKTGSALFAVGFSIFVVIILTLFSTHFLKDYGWGVFLGLPFILGFSSSLIYGYHVHRKFSQCVGVTLTSLFLTSALLLILAIEGIICIAMAFPIGLIIALIGTALGYAIQSKNKPGAPMSLGSIIVMMPLLMSLESATRPEAEIYSVSSSVIIDAPSTVVWNNVIAFSTLPDPEEFVFKSGIAYPIKAEIQGRGVGAVRCCIFNTGKFVEPIVVWEDEKILEFTVDEQPHPMTELSPYGEIDAPHLDGYFASTRGQFLLIPQKDGTILLKGTTWYYNKLWPNSYWKIWSDYLLHKIHLRVLNHIKKLSEQTV
ncbi:MAG: DUF805 domain-containing protein [Bacteroidota bacterium]|nr:DUF805 domain-containing protein [Bacteroidota bacterium]